ncbi:MAG: type I pullulanase [Lachnospiraceae bacterium]|nr:type I pullulanase [Lachnospiraceae bacterium]
MDQEKKFCRKKRSIANSMLSLILVFAMVISNVQTSSGMLSTVWAAESEAQTSDGEARTGSMDEGNDSDGEETGEVLQTLDSEEADENERSEGKEETTQTGERSEETSESGDTGTKAPPVVETETATETEIASSTETETVTQETETGSDIASETETAETETTDEETTEEESKESDADEASVAAKTVRIHFSNTLGWDNVYLNYWGDGIDGTGWMKYELTEKDSDGYYTEDVTISNLTGDFGFIYATGSDGNANTQTVDGIISKATLNDADLLTEDGVYECWAWLDGSQSDGKYNIQVSRNEFRKPVIGTDDSGNTSVTFYYDNSEKKSVELKGVYGDVWNDSATKIDETLQPEEGTDYYKCSINLNPEGIMYKFVVDGNWIFDPGNTQVVNGNSYVSEASSNATIRIHFKNTLNWENVSLHYWGMGITGTDWPGIKVSADEDDANYYTIDVNADGLKHDFGFIYNDGKPDNARQSANGYIKRTDLADDETYELWVWLDESKKDSEGKYILQVSKSQIVSPEIDKEDGSKVTFRYQGDTGSQNKVYLVGSMTDWLDGEPVELKDDDGNGVWECTVTLDHGEYEYKYIVPKTASPGTDGANYDWYLDELNPLYSEKNGKKENSVVYVPGSEEFTYTIHYYNPEKGDMALDAPDLYTWEPGINFVDTAKFYSYQSKDLDENGIPWLTTEFTVPYRTFGFIGKPTAGKDNWSGQDSNRIYQINQLRGGVVDENKTKAEIWYIHGKGIYETKPKLAEVSEVKTFFIDENGNQQAKISIDYTQNRVLHLNVGDGILIKEAYVDASELGISSKLNIDPELLAVSLSVTEDTPVGTVRLPVTVVDYQGKAVNTTAEIEVTAKSESDNDFDWDEAVIYFMVTDRFADGDTGNNQNAGEGTFDKNDPGLYHGGDIAGIRAHLNDLKELGVNTIWITPIVKNIPKVQVEDGTGDVPNYAAYHGYWASDFQEINGALGTKDEFQSLINEIHDKDMKIMVDVVVNHAGYGTEDSETFNGMLRNAAIEDDTLHGGGGQAGLPDFMTENPDVRDMIIGWQLDWAKMGVDYFRVDTVKHVDSTTWMAFKNALTEQNPKFKLIGEYYGASYASENGGTLGSGQMDSLLDFNFKYQAANFVRGNISSVETELAKRNAALDNTYLTGQFLSSHDENGFKFNLQQGENKMETAAADAAALVAATLQITAKGQPVIYYGEEIGLTGENNYPYQTNRYDYNWDMANDSNTVYKHYKTMLNIRQKYSEIFARGDRKVIISSNSDGYDVISRSYNGETIYVGMNIKPNQAKENLELAVNSDGITQYKDEYSGSTYQVTDGIITITIPKASEGGTVVLVPAGFSDTLIAPQITTVAKGKTTSLPSQLTHIAEDGTKTLANVTYSIRNSVDGVSLDEAKTKLTVEDTFEGTEIQLTATAESTGSVDFVVRAVEDKNEIVVKLHYSRSDNNYTDWNVWAWPEGKGGTQYDFESENGDMVATAKFEGRSIGALGYRIRKGNWAEDDPIKDDRYIDLSNILSGTVHYYVESGKFDGTMAMEEDVLLGSKVLSAKYNQNTNRITVVIGGYDAVGDINDLFTVKSYNNTVIPITKVTKRDNSYVLSIDTDLSGIDEVVKSYFVTFDGYDYKITMPVAYSSAEFENNYTYDGDDLGATWSRSSTTFKLWAPTADKVQVKLYKSGTEGADDLIEVLDMERGDKGVWILEKDGDLNGTYYTYNVTVDGRDTEACDPYARTTGVNGNRAMVINLDATNPEGWASDRGPNAGMSYTDSIIYELHVRDFSIKENSGISDEHKGKFLGLIESGTTNPNGQPTGLDYLTDLGVTHIHLLPSYDYATVDETKLDTPQFNWGYDPKNYNVPEGSYSTDPYNGEVRVKEMKQMIKTLHDNNINVIMDVVYNHVYDADQFCFNQIVPKYFSRTNADGSYSNGSGCGNDTASERAMVKKYIVDSVNYWADEYHIDGFRFDLVGLLDTETINEVVDTVHEKHPDAVFYGEGWTLGTAVSKEGYTMATQANAAYTPKFAYFSDTIRDLLKGSNDEVSLGFVSGLTGKESNMADCFQATAWWSKNPAQIVNYASCHDNYTLKDKLNATAGKTNTEADVIRMNNLAAAIYMTAEGIPLIHAGEEILRTKTDEDGNIIHNSYNSPDSVNQIKWEDLDKAEYRAVRDYYKGLIEFRKNHAALRLDSAEAVKENVKYHWVTNEVIMFVINGKDSVADEVSDGIVIIFNATNSNKSVNLYDAQYGIEKGTWNVCINDDKAGTKILSTVSDGSVTVAPISATVLVKGETVDENSVYGKNEQQNTERQRKQLQDLIDSYERIEKGNYTDESWNAFQSALESARQVVKDMAATHAQLVNAKENLKAAFDALEVPQGVVDTGKLDALIAECKETEKNGQGNYTIESWTLFTEALAAAETVRAKQDVTQEEINIAYDNLKSAYDGLRKPAPNFDKLNDLISEYNNLEQGNYTDESWEVFVNALAAAKAAVAKPDVTQEEIDQAEQTLKAAYDALKVKDGALDTGKLKALVKKCQAILEQGQGEYTNKSWEVFKNALTAAETILTSETATQEDIDCAYKNLDEAQKGLTKTDEPEIPEGLWTKWADNSGLEIGEDGKYHITYTGKALKPAILVFDGATQLKEKTDYTISYKDNTNASTGEKEATVTIKGKGNYSEFFEEKFVIDQVDMSTLQIDDLYALVKVSDNQVQGTVALKPVVKYNGKTLKVNKDYTAAFVNDQDGKTPGIYPVRVQAVNANFKNYKDIEITIADKANTVPMNKVKISKITNQPYVWDETTKQGKVQTPEFTVSYKDETLNENEQYTVKYDTVHTEAGQTATIIIKGKGMTYVGEKKVSFKITGQPLKANMVTVNVPSQGLEYTGEAQKPDVTVNLGTDGQKPYDQYEVEYQKNTDVGKATVVVKGINGYTGTVKKTFKITAYDIMKENSLFTFGTDNVITDLIPYAKGGSKLSDKNVGARFVTSTGTTLNLVQGRDYTLSYRNNAKVSADGNTASVTIKGKGNFKGTIADRPFTIKPQNLENLKGSITAGDIVVKDAKKYNKVIPVITDLNGKKLKNKTDFTVTSESYIVSGQVDASGNPEKGAEVTINVKATEGSNYEGNVSTTFRVIDNNNNISKAVIKVKPQVYTGKAIELEKDDIESITMKIGRDKVNLTHNDFEIVGYTNNIKKGTAKVTIRGLGEYGGTKTVTFKITAQPMSGR